MTTTSLHPDHAGRGGTARQTRLAALRVHAVARLERAWNARPAPVSTSALGTPAAPALPYCEPDDHSAPGPDGQGCPCTEAPTR